MRITQQSILNSALQRLTSRLAEFGETQQRLSTGKRIQRPSDDPVGMTMALEMRSSQRAREQESRNAADANMWVNLADSRLQSALDRLQRARELAVRGATFTSATEHEAMAAEVASIRDDLVSLANSRHQGRGLFAGFSADDAVVKSGGVWSYQGDNGQVERRIGLNDVVTVNLTADDAFGFTGVKDVFAMLDDFETSLLGSDQAGIDTAIAEIDSGIKTVLTSLARIGAAGNRIEAAQHRNLMEIESLRTHLSAVEDVDMAEAVMELQIQESAYQAALAAFSRAAQPSLVHFLS